MILHPFTLIENEFSMHYSTHCPFNYTFQLLTPGFFILTRILIIINRHINNYHMTINIIKYNYIYYKFIMYNNILYYV